MAASRNPKKIVDPMTGLATVRPKIDALIDEVHKLCDATGHPDCHRILNRLQSCGEIADRHLFPAPVEATETAAEGGQS